MKILQIIIDILIKISPFLSVVAILISALTLRELQKQRKESYKPRLFFKNKNFFIQKNPNGTPCFLKENPEEVRGLYCPTFYLDLENIGLAAAHTIQIKWKYNQNNLVKKLKEYVEGTNLLRVNKHNHFEFLFDKKKKSGYGFIIDPPEDEKQEIAFLRDSTKIRIPDTLQNYLTFTAYLELFSQGIPRRIDMKINDFEVFFEFFDISGKKHIQYLKILLEVFAYAKVDHNLNFSVGSMIFTIK